MECVFICFRYKRVENRWKMSKVYTFGRISPWTFKNCQKWSLEEIFWRKVNNSPLGIKEWQILPLKFKIAKMAKRVPQVSNLSESSPGHLNFGNYSTMVLDKWNMASLVLGILWEVGMSKPLTFDKLHNWSLGLNSLQIKPDLININPLQI